MSINNIAKAIVISVTTLGASLLPVNVSSRSEYWHQRVTLFNLIPVEKGDIVFLGNSITDGGEFCELFDNPSIKNRGISSDVISGVIERLHQVTDNQPAKIFLLIGINDVSHNLTLDQLSQKYEELISEIRTQSPESKLYVQSLMPINNDFGRYKNLKGKESVIKQLNSRLEELSQHYGAVYVDLWPALADEKTGKLRREFTNDGLHLLGKGYEAWAEHIRPLVEE